jgi:deoxyguanosine kinase
MASETTHKYIVVEGPIGVGKTSLARRLCTSLGAQPLLEQAAQNPFLERFYKNPRAGALPTQLYFLLQRAQQLAQLKQADLFAPVRVADYLLDKDRLFARVTLDEAEYALYEQLYAKLDIQTPKPDLVVYLQAPVDVLLERIAKRGVEYEQHIDRQYLERLNEAYARFFHEYSAAPLLIVNAASIDPISNQHDYDELLAAIKRMSRGRLYYNPLRSRAI